MSLGREGAWFAAGGVLGFIVDAGVLQLLVGPADWNPYLARLPSFVLAATFTWWWNRRFTFAARRGHGRTREWSLWVGVMTVGAVLNYAVYAAALATLAPVRAWPWLGVAAGSAVAAVANFAAARTLVFRGRDDNV